MKYKYDPEHKLSYEFYECETCSVKFYGGGPAIHNDDCPVKDGKYDSYTLVFGPNQVTEVRRLFHKYNDDGRWYGLNMTVLREQFPELLEESEQ